MFEIIKTYQEEIPECRFIGKRYTEADRGKDGSFGNIWGQWFQEGLFAKLEINQSLAEMGASYIGFMRGCPEFEYWIGIFFPADTTVPEGFDSIDLGATKIVTSWIQGQHENGEIYGMEPHNACVKAAEDFGVELPKCNMFFERYDHTRFGVAGDDGKVVLDYCIYL